MMLASGYPVQEISKSLGIGENLVYRWKNDNNAEKDNNSENSASTQSDLFVENEQMKAELRCTEQERNILKKSRELVKINTAIDKLKMKYLLQRQ
ncbi:transposase [Chitinophaga sp. YR573]|nr:transposase [Chitinophaga sp. YR573]